MGFDKLTVRDSMSLSDGSCTLTSLGRIGYWENELAGMVLRLGTPTIALALIFF
jgi:hypothetical protein